MLDPRDDKGGRIAELAFESDFPCMDHDEQGYGGEYRCRYTDRRYDVKSGYRPSTGNVAIAAHQFLHQSESGAISCVSRIDGEWQELNADAFLLEEPRIRVRKEGYSDTHYLLVSKAYWRPFQHIHSR